MKNDKTAKKMSILGSWTKNRFGTPMVVEIGRDSTGIIPDMDPGEAYGGPAVSMSAVQSKF